MKKKSAVLILTAAVILLCAAGTVSAQIPPAPVIPTIVPVIPKPPVPVIPTIVPVIPTPFVPPSIPTPYIPPFVPSHSDVPSIPTPFDPVIPTSDIIPGVPVTELAKPAQEWDLSSYPEVPTAVPAPKEGKERYDEAMAFFEEERYYSAWKAFTESKYEDWEDWAAKCPQPRPSTGEVWHDPSQWLRDMDLTIEVDQPQTTDMFFRIYKAGELVSNVYISGPGKVTVELPGNANYSIKDGLGSVWYGEKEAFGKSGTYETMTFDDYGSETVYLESGYSYTLSINVAENTDGSDVDSKYESWENFAE